MTTELEDRVLAYEASIEAIDLVAMRRYNEFPSWFEGSWMPFAIEVGTTAKRIKDGDTPSDLAARLDRWKRRLAALRIEAPFDLLEPTPSIGATIMGDLSISIEHLGADVIETDELTPQYDIVDEQNDPDRLTELGIDLVGADVLVGDFLSDIGGFFTTDIPKFVSDHKDLIAGAATVLAGAGATALLGPAGGAVAAGLVKSQIEATHGSGDTKAQAQANLDQAKAQAQVNPSIGKADAIAKTSVDQAAAGYVIADQAQKAKAGDPKAKAAMANVNAAAKAGDPNAQKIQAIAAGSDAARARGDSVATGGSVLAPVAIAAGLGALLWALL